MNKNLGNGMEIQMLIDCQTTEKIKILNTIRNNRPGCLCVIGELVENEQILVQRALVSDPDETNDSHWKTAQENDADVVLRVGHDWYSVPVGVIVRAVKPTTTNAVGVSWS